MMTNQNNSLSRNSEAGVAIVEAAVILLVFFMFIFGIFEAARFINYRQVLTNAAREGARFSVTPITGTNTLPSTGEITDRVNDYLSSAHISAVTPEIDTVSVATGSVLTTYTRVRVEHPYSVITVPGFFDVLEVNLAGEALMRNETSD
jgi:Flp pilus assembly protein TadG